MSKLPTTPTAHWQYARFIYETVRRSGIRVGARVAVNDDLFVEMPNAKPKEVWFYDGAGTRLAWIPCPCTGVKVVNFDDKSVQGEVKLSKYHNLAVAVETKFTA